MIDSDKKEKLDDIAKQIVLTAIDDGIRVQLEMVIKLLPEKLYNIEEYFFISQQVQKYRSKAVVIFKED